MKRKKLSIIIPLYNESENLPKIHEELMAVRQSSLKAYDFEVIFMDNHSTDDSFAVATELGKNDPAVRVIRLSRNFGYQANIITGFLAATGDAAIQLDADGEDDPVLIADFVREWELGNKVVYGIRQTRHESWILRGQRKIFYRLIRRLSEIDIPLDSGDFRLVDRAVLEVLRSCKEAKIYIRGLVSFAGFEQKGIPYDRRPRYKGVSKFRWWDYFRLAIDGITSFSQKPLTFVTLSGLFISGATFIGAIVYLARYLLGGIEVKGFTTLILTQLFVAGIQLLCMGVIGTYVGKIFDEVKARPKSVIEKTFPQDS